MMIRGVRDADCDPIAWIYDHYILASVIYTRRTCVSGVLQTYFGPGAIT